MKIENNNLSEEAIKIRNIDLEINLINNDIFTLENQLKYQLERVEKLKERKKSLLNYLNTDNN